MAAVADRWPLVGRWEELETFGAAVARPDRDGVVLFGAPGVGKTRLADEFRAQLERSGRRTMRAVASRSAASAPLGAIAHLLPVEVVRSGVLGGADAAIAFRQAADAFGAEAVPPALVIDDLHLLDSTSVALLEQLVESGIVLLVGTVRSDEPVPDGIEALLRGGRVVRVELTPLERDDVDSLLHLALGGPVDGAAMVALWSASRGNVLFLRELVLSARASGALRKIDDVWTLSGPIEGSGRLVELVAERVQRADPVGMPVLETLAWCQRIPVAHALRIAPPTALDALEREELIVIVADDRRRDVTLAHPLYGEVLRGAMGVLRSRRLLVEQVERVRRDGARRREDPLLIATWQLEAGVDADTELLLRAARLALYSHDFGHVERLARAAHREEPTAEAALLLGEALYQLGHFDEAEAVLAAADDEHHVDIATVRSMNLLWGLRRPDDALAVRRRAGAVARTEAARAELRAGESAVLVFSGRPRDAIELLDAEPRAADSRASVARAIAEAPALALVGRTADALAVARRAFAEHAELGDVVAMAHPGSHVFAQVLALMEGGELAEAQDLARAMHEVTVTGRIPIPRMWSTLNLGRVTLLSGRPVSARRWFMECAALAGTTGFVSIRRLALSGVAMSAAMVGDADAAADAAAEIAPDAGDRTFVLPELWLGPAWAAIAGQDPVRARACLREGAAVAADTGHRSSEAWLLHDVARLGAPEDVTEALSALARCCDGVLVAARAAHAEALAQGDAEALEAVVDSFAAMGAQLFAAEAAVAAADAFGRAGDQRRATSLRGRAAALSELCEGARTLGLVTGRTVVPLTSREREIALLAAEGLSSKDIGERLSVSARTVDNHLQRVFTKLGVTRRAELGDALA